MRCWLLGKAAPVAAGNERASSRGMGLMYSSLLRGLKWR